MIKMLHTVTTLKQPIKVPTELEVCDVCAMIKIQKHISRILAAHKEQKLALLSVNIAGPWPASMGGYNWFAEVIDNWSRKVWILLLITRMILSKNSTNWLLYLKDKLEKRSWPREVTTLGKSKRSSNPGRPKME
jgi:hypothetical protein